MKKIIINTFVMGFVVVVNAQGWVALDNVSNTSTNPLATASGLFWLSTGGTPALINQDFNAAFYGGATSKSLSLIATFLLSDGTATHDNPFPGIFLDPTGNSYLIPGTVTSVFIQIQAWTGNFNSYAGALNGGAPAVQSPVFVNPLNNFLGPPADLTGMPAMVLAVPEPSTFALAGLGGVCALLLVLWRGRRNTNEKANP